MEERNLHLIALSLIKGLGPVTVKNLIAYCGSPQDVFTASPLRLQKAPGVGEKTVALIKGSDHLARAEQEVAYCEKHGIRILNYLDADYPQLLKHSHDAPLTLFVKGNVDFNQQTSIAIVGTRRATDYGKEITDTFATAFARAGINVVSGLAYGIDIQAHRAVLKEGGITTGVVGHGLDTLYPFSHKKKADEMLEKGGLLTEFISGTKPDASNFPARNRIISGISRAVVVIEAAESGGALITANFANDQNREVYAIPGRLNDPYSAGCNKLIQRNLARMVTSPDEILDDLEIAWRTNAAQPPQLSLDFAPLTMPLTPNESKVIDFLTKGEALVDQISVQTGLHMSVLNPLLIGLEFRDLIKQMPGKRYKRC